jgi:hypothetical protein
MLRARTNDEQVWLNASTSKVAEGAAPVSIQSKTSRRRSPSPGPTGSSPYPIMRLEPFAQMSLIMSFGICQIPTSNTELLALHMIV